MMRPQKGNGFRADPSVGTVLGGTRSDLLRAGRAFAHWTALPIALFVGWLGLILGLSSMSASTVESSVRSSGTGGLPVDVISHLALYTVLGILTAWSVRRLVPTWGWSVACVPVAGAFGFLWGLFDEWYQHFFPGRVTSWGDVGLDTAGGFAGGLLLYSLHLLFRKLRPLAP